MSTPAIVDWFSATCEESIFEDIPYDSLQLFRAWFGGIALAEDSRGSRNFFTFSRVFYVIVSNEPVEVGFVAWGGHSQRGRLNVCLNGKGCSLVLDWSKVSQWCDYVSATLTRVDVAVDFLDGQFSIDDAKARYIAGDFNFNNQPSCRWIGPPPGTPNAFGVTFEIGRRKNGKLCRVYEKGKQLGDQSSPWVRVEVELHNRDRVIPFDVLTEPTKYFAGSYPFFPSLVDLVGERIATFQHEHDIAADALTENLRRCYGKAISSLRDTFKSDEHMVSELSVAGVPKRLRRSSLKLIRGTPSPEENLKNWLHEASERRKAMADGPWEFGEQDQRRFRTAGKK